MSGTDLELCRINGKYHRAKPVDTYPDSKRVKYKCLCGFYYYINFASDSPSLLPSFAEYLVNRHAEIAASLNQEGVNA